MVKMFLWKLTLAISIGVGNRCTHIGYGEEQILEGIKVIHDGGTETPLQLA